MPRRKTIGLQLSEYEVLARAKEAHEAERGEQTDWGQFLLVLLGLYIAYLAKKKLEEANSKPNRAIK